MGDGEVLEFEEPNLLIQNIDSHFYHLVSQEFSDNEWKSWLCIYLPIKIFIFFLRETFYKCIVL